MLSMEQFPYANKDWEEIDVYQRMGKRRKQTYRAAANKAPIKKKAADRKDQFWAAHTATPPLGDDTMGNTTGNNQPMGLASLNRYFDNLVAAATIEKAVLEELVTNPTNLTTSNAEMAETIKNLTGENRKLHQQLNSSKKIPQDECGP